MFVVGFTQILLYTKIYIFSLNATENSSIHIGRTVNEVYENLLPLGNIYNFELDYDEYYYKTDRTHNVLKYVYSGLYPINEILSSVKKVYLIYFQFVKINFISVLWKV